jgi:type IV pilus assembly protein PilQ
MNNMINKYEIFMNPRTFTMTCWSRNFILASQSIVALGLLLLVGVAQSAELRSLDYSALPGDKAKIQLTFSEPVGEPHSFATDEPARIVIDIAGVQNKLAERTKQVNVGVTRSISAVEAGDRT